MLKPFQSFMKEIIDYAGLFPPAELSMEEAIQQYAGYRKSPEAWMLARFICPASRLRELRSFRETLFRERESFRFSLLGSSGKNRAHFMNRLEKDLHALEEFMEYHQERVQVEIFEVRLPQDILQERDISATTDFLSEVALTIEKFSPVALTAFYEAPLEQHWQDILRTTVKGLAEHNRYIGGAEHFQRYRSAGFKLRCGGTETRLYPTPEQVAMAILECHRYRLPMKATAGLHQPVRHYNDSLQVHEYGFFNLFTAAILADAHDLELRQIQEIVEDTEAGNFLFTKRAFAWRNLRSSVEEIEHGRSRGLISFGSCSFEEPRAHLRKMNLL